MEKYNRRPDYQNAVEFAFAVVLDQISNLGIFVGNHEERIATLEKRLEESITLNEADNKSGKPGPKPGFKRSAVNADGTPRKKPGPKPGMKRGKYNQDGSLRQKPGPKPGSKSVKNQVS